MSAAASQRNHQNGLGPRTPRGFVWRCAHCRGALVLCLVGVNGRARSLKRGPMCLSSRRDSKDIWMRIEEDTKAQEAIHSADERTEPDLIPPKRTRAPKRTKSPPSAAIRTQSHPIATIRIQSQSTVPIGTHSNSIAPNRMQLHLPSDVIILQTMYLSSGQCSLSQ